MCVCVCVCVCGTNIPAHVASSPSNGYKSWAEAWVIDEATPHVLGITENYLQLLFFPQVYFFTGLGCSNAIALVPRPQRETPDQSLYARGALE